MNRFAQGQARLVEHLLTRAYVDIIYHKLEGGLDTPIPLRVWPNYTLFKILEKDNQRMEWSHRDYMIPVAILAVGVDLFQPSKEHWIEEAFPGIGVLQFQIAAPEKEPVWRYDDLQKTVYRIHTMRVTG